MSKKKGLVYKLQNFAIHDGPGIRTLVYMKGCPLNCTWCSSPQTQKRGLDILHLETLCKVSGRCVEACPLDAITLSATEGLLIDRKACDYCGECVEACPEQALELAGGYMTVEELFEQVAKDSVFFRRSNGGVTVGGGEATMQAEFVTDFLKMCQQRFIHTAMESCAFVKWEILEKILEYLDLAFFDIKHMDAEIHKQLTGVSNELILANVRKAAALRPLIIRIPTVPGHNDSDDNILATARFAAELGENLLHVELLPYHKFGTQTYRRLGLEYTLADLEPPSEEHMNRLKEIVESCGVTAEIGV